MKNQMNKETILKRLKSEEVGTVRETIFSLANQVDLEEEVVVALVNHLDNRNKGIQSAAFDVLRRSPNTTVVKHVLPKISVMDLSLRNTAMSILQDLGVVTLAILDQAIHKSTDVDEVIQYLVVVGGIGSKKGTPLAVEFCKHADNNVKSTAIEALGKIGDADAIPTLLDLFEKEEDIRYTIAEALGRIGDMAGFETLKAGLKSQDILLYFSAIQGLGYFRSEHCLPLLVEELKTADTSTKKIVLKSLYEIEMALPGCIAKYGEDSDFLDKLIEMSRDLSNEENLHFARIISSIRHPKLVEPLLGLLESDDGALRCHASLGLSRFGPEVKSGLVGKLDSKSSATVIEAIRLLKNLNDVSVVDTLKAHVNNPNSAIRKSLAELLCKVGGEEAKEILKYLARDTDENVRMVVAEGLGTMADKELIPSLVPMFKDTNGHVRRLSILSTGKIGASEITGDLFNVVQKEPYGDVREAAAGVLAASKEMGNVTELMKLMGSDNDRIRDAVTKEIYLTGSEHVANALVLRLKDNEWRIVISALQSLAKLGKSDCVTDIIKCTKSEDWQIKINAIDALGSFKGPEAEKVLLAAVEDTNPIVAQKAISGLKSYGSEGIRKALTRALGSEHLMVRYQSAKVLARHKDSRTIEETAKALLHQLEREDNNGVVVAIIDSLRELGRSDLLPEKFGPFFDNPDSNVRVAIINYLLAFDAVTPQAEEVIVLLLEGDDWLKSYFTHLYHEAENPVLKGLLAKACTCFEKRFLEKNGRSFFDLHQFREFLTLSQFINRKTGLSVTDKKGLFGKLNKEVGRNYLENFADYYFFLQYAPEAQNKKAIEALFDTITNPGTRFFDEKEQMNVFIDLVNEFIAAKEKAGIAPKIRILSAGTSFGPEPYTMGMVISERVRNDHASFEIHGVDISQICLNTAKRGIFKQEMFKTVEPKYVENYTEDDRGDLRIVDSIKNMIQFKFLNLADSVAMSDLNNFDIVMCRNVFSGMTLEYRQRLAESLYSALNPNGVMFISSHESLHDATKAFRLVNYANTVVYKKA